jgi:hypothetical protein
MAILLLIGKVTRKDAGLTKCLYLFDKRVNSRFREKWNPGRFGNEDN